MNIDNKVLAYLEWKHEATWEQVQIALGMNAGAVYQSLRRLAIQGDIDRRFERQHATRRKITKWSIKKWGTS
jgi:hypothetical protein